MLDNIASLVSKWVVGRMSSFLHLLTDFSFWTADNRQRSNASEYKMKLEKLFKEKKLGKYIPCELQTLKLLYTVLFLSLSFCQYLRVGAIFNTVTWKFFRFRHEDQLRYRPSIIHLSSLVERPTIIQVSLSNCFHFTSFCQSLSYEFTNFSNGKFAFLNQTFPLISR